MQDLSQVLLQSELLVSGYVRGLEASPSSSPIADTPSEIIRLILQRVVPRDKFGLCFGESISMYGRKKEKAQILSGHYGPHSVFKQGLDQISYAIANGPCYDSGYGSIAVTVDSSSTAIAEWTLLCSTKKKKEDPEDWGSQRISLSIGITLTQAMEGEAPHLAGSRDGSYSLSRDGEFRQSYHRVYQHKTGRFGDGDVVTMTLDTKTSVLDFKVNDVPFEKVVPKPTIDWASLGMEDPDAENEAKGKYVEDGKYCLFVCVSGSGVSVEIIDFVIS